MNETQPLIPAAPWYTSPTQVAGLVAGLSQVVSISVRWFGLPLSEQQLQMYTADVLQLVTIAAGAYAMYKRQTSLIAPLTMTRKAADTMTAANPPMLDNDPAKVHK